MGTLVCLIIWIVIQIACNYIPNPGGGTEKTLSEFLPLLFNVWSAVFGVLIIYFLGGLNAITHWHRMVIFRFGRYVKTVGPGLVWVDPLFHRALDGRTEVHDQVWRLGMGNTMTKDAVPVSANFVMTFRVVDAAKFVLEMCDGWRSIERRSKAAVAHIFSSMKLDEILNDREHFNSQALTYLRNQIGERWGVEIITIELQEMLIEDESIRRAMALKATAERECEAKVLRSDAEVAVARNLEAAAKIYGNPMAAELRRLETVSELGQGTNNTVLFSSSALDVVSKIVAQTKTEPAPAE